MASAQQEVTLAQPAIIPVQQEVTLAQPAIIPVMPHNHDECKQLALTIRGTTYRMVKTRHLAYYLRLFARSRTCTKALCTKVCRLYAKMHHHMQMFPGENKCYVGLMHGALYRAHLWWCKDQDCPMPECPLSNAEQMVIPCICELFFDVGKDYNDITNHATEIRKRMKTHQKSQE